MALEENISKCLSIEEIKSMVVIIGKQTEVEGDILSHVNTSITIHNRHVQKPKEALCIIDLICLF